MSEKIIAAITGLEQERASALIAGDYVRLAGLNTDDLVHIHATGQVESKDEYLRNTQEKLEFLEVSRPTFDVRIYGDAAISTGLLKQKIRVKAVDMIVDMEAAVTQVWRQDGGQWRCCSFQATNIG
ncbi:Ketosteroid isomerase homolog [Sphingobium faniae]|nr:Ketosteroid isomerase homolog [Sphingobium faniae]